MLTVTDAASERFARMLTELQAPSDAAIRMVLEQNGLRIRVDRPAPSDVQFKHQGRTVLVLDQQMSQILSHKTVDLERGNGTARLAMI